MILQSRIEWKNWIVVIESSTTASCVGYLSKKITFTVGDRTKTMNMNVQFFRMCRQLAPLFWNLERVFLTSLQSQSDLRKSSWYLDCMRRTLFKLRISWYVTFMECKQLMKQSLCPIAPAFCPLPAFGWLAIINSKHRFFFFFHRFLFCFVLQNSTPLQHCRAAISWVGYPW